MRWRSSVRFAVRESISSCVDSCWTIGTVTFARGRWSNRPSLFTVSATNRSNSPLANDLLKDSVRRLRDSTDPSASYCVRSNVTDRDSPGNSHINHVPFDGCPLTKEKRWGVCGVASLDSKALTESESTRLLLDVFRRENVDPSQSSFIDEDTEIIWLRKCLHIKTHSSVARVGDEPFVWRSELPLRLIRPHLHSPVARIRSRSSPCRSFTFHDTYHRNKFRRLIIARRSLETTLPSGEGMCDNITVGLRVKRLAKNSMHWFVRIQRLNSRWRESRCSNLRWRCRDQFLLPKYSWLDLNDDLWHSSFVDNSGTDSSKSFWNVFALMRDPTSHNLYPDFRNIESVHRHSIGVQSPNL